MSADFKRLMGLLVGVVLVLFVLVLTLPALGRHGAAAADAAGQQVLCTKLTFCPTPVPAPRRP